jgi:hypothetical protein
MIKANELRFGNFVSNVDGKTMPITTIEKDGVTLFRFYLNQTDKHPDKTAIISDVISFDKIEPIPLTEEWLIKCGFEFNHWESKNREQKTVCFNRISIELWEDGRFYMVEIDLFITTIHQLQNLYFALTGTELTIKVW